MRKLMRNTRSFLAAAMLIALSSTGARAGTIDTTSLWNGTNDITVWGSNNTPTYGQTFTALAGLDKLTSMTFMINNLNATANYQAFVYAWNGTTITGPALFASPGLTLPAVNGFQAVSVNTGSTSLVDNQQYVAFFTTTTQAETSTGSGLGFLGTSTLGADDYSGGNFVYNNGLTFASLTSGWQNPTGFFGVSGLAGADLAFTLTFAPLASVPEPGSLILVATGLAGASLSFSRLRRTRTA